MQVNPIKLVLKAPGPILLKLRCDGPLSNVAFKFNLRRHTKRFPDSMSKTVPIWAEVRRCRLTL